MRFRYRKGKIDEKQIPGCTNGTDIPLTGEKWVQFYVEENVGVFCEHWKMCASGWKRDTFDTLEEAMERYNKLAATDTRTVVYPTENGKD